MKLLSILNKKKKINCVREIVNVKIEAVHSLLLKKSIICTKKIVYYCFILQTNFFTIIDLYFKLV